MKAVGSAVPLISTSNMGDFAGIGAGSPLTADVVYAPASFHGRFWMDALLAYLGGKRNVTVEYPSSMLDCSNWDADGLVAQRRPARRWVAARRARESASTSMRTANCQQSNVDYLTTRCFTWVL
jgi:hypothetical protein